MSGLLGPGSLGCGLMKAPHVATPSYANTGGTGDRTALITLTKGAGLSFHDSAAATFNLVLVDGLSQNNLWVNGSVDSTAYLRFDFGSGASKVITEVRLLRSDSSNEPMVQWQGSNNATDWTSIGSPVQMGGAPSSTMSLSSNTTGYRYYQCYPTSGTWGGSAWLYEYEFKLDDA